MLTQTPRITRIRSAEFVEPWPEPYVDLEVQTSLELLEEYSLPGDLGQLDDWQGYSYVRMAQLATDLYAYDGPVDLVAVAYATPDLMLAGVLGCYLVERLGGNPHVFGVSDQAGGAGFSALDLAGAVMAAEGLADGLLVAVDQQSVYHPPGAAWAPETNAFVVIELGSAAGLELVGHGVVSTRDPEQHLAALTVDAHALYLGGTLGELVEGRAELPPIDCITGPRGSCTSVWRALEAKWPTEGTVVIADYDPFAGRLHHHRLRVSSGIAEDAR